LNGKDVTPSFFEKLSNPPSSPFAKGEKRWLSGKTFRKNLLPLKKGGREGFLSR
jgi:hypothetical protein